MATPVCTFDYIPTANGDAEIRGECHQNASKIVCKLTEVHAFPISSINEATSINSVRMDYNLRFPKPKREFESLSRAERLEEWKRFFIKKAEGNSVIFSVEKEDCAKDPRDYYQFGAAYNETYDPFLNKAKVIHTKMCNAKAPNDLANAKVERWNLERSTCELAYAEYEETFVKKEGKWISEYDKPKGPERFTKCFNKMTGELRIKGTICSLERNYIKFETKDSGESAIRRKFTIGPFVGPLIKTCEYPAKKEAVFAAGPRKLPKPCEFVLDRERAAYCCAYNTK